MERNPWLHQAEISGILKALCFSKSRTIFWLCSTRCPRVHAYSPRLIAWGDNFKVTVCCLSLPSHLFNFLQDLKRANRTVLPITPPPASTDSDAETTAVEIGPEEAWNNYKSRNDSKIVDLFQGQLKSEVTCNTCNKVCFGLNLILEFVRRVNYICIFLRFLSHTTLSAIWLSLYLHSIGEELPKQFLSPKSSICLFHHRRWAVTNLGIALNASALASPARKITPRLPEIQVL